MKRFYGIVCLLCATGCSYHLKYTEVPYRKIDTIDLPDEASMIKSLDARAAKRKLILGNIRIQHISRYGGFDKSKNYGRELYLPEAPSLNSYIDKQLKKWMNNNNVKINLTDSFNFLTASEGFTVQLTIKDLRYHELFEIDFNVKISKGKELLVDRDLIAVGYDFPGDVYDYERLPNTGSSFCAFNTAFGFAVRDICERTAKLLAKAKTLADKGKN